MKALPFIDLLRDLDRAFKLLLGLIGCFVAPLMIWAGAGLLILWVLGVHIELARPAVIGSQLILIGFFWEIVNLFTFDDIQELADE